MHRARVSRMEKTVLRQAARALNRISRSHKVEQILSRLAGIRTRKEIPWLMAPYRIPKDSLRTRSDMDPIPKEAILRHSDKIRTRKVVSLNLSDIVRIPKARKATR